MTSLTELPEGVSATEWTEEKDLWQDPRIRAFLVCIRVLDEVFESNYAILHCSPKRLEQIWEEIRKITTILKDEVAPLLKGRSKIPELEKARESADLYLEIIDNNLLRSIEAYPRELSEDQHDGVRKLLCVAIGQLHAFLLDTLGEMLARDPRSPGDTDYHLTRKFARDVDEAEWLHTSVSGLEEYLLTFTATESKNLESVGQCMAEQRRVPSAEEWQPVKECLDGVSGGIVSRLKNVLGLRGMRLSELELLDRHASQLPSICQTLMELHASALATVLGIEQQLRASHREACDAAVNIIHAEFASRLRILLRELQNQIRDLATYLPIWRQSIENRRAMILRRPRE